MYINRSLNDELSINNREEHHFHIHISLSLCIVQISKKNFNSYHIILLIFLVLAWIWNLQLVSEPTTCFEICWLVVFLILLLIWSFFLLGILCFSKFSCEEHCICVRKTSSLIIRYSQIPNPENPTQIILFGIHFITFGIHIYRIHFINSNKAYT